MKKIKFDCNGNSAPAYGCDNPGDNSGEYIPAEVAQRLYDALDRLADVYDGDWDDSDLVDARAALAAADGEEV